MGFGISSSIGTGFYTFKDKYLPFRNSILLSSTLICLLELLVILFSSQFISEVIGFSVSLVLIVGVTAFAHYIVNFAQMSFYMKRGQ